MCSELKEKISQAQEVEDSAERKLALLRDETNRLKQRKIQRDQSRRQVDARNEPELLCFEKSLGLYIVGHKDDQDVNYMKFIYTLIDPQDFDRQYSFVVNVDDKDYRSRL